MFRIGIVSLVLMIASGAQASSSYIECWYQEPSRWPNIPQHSFHLTQHYGIGAAAYCDRKE